MKVKMLPDGIKGATDGISQVVRAYLLYLPQFDIELVRQSAKRFDLIAAHAGFGENGCDVSHCHGLYWTADYPGLQWEYYVNSTVVGALKNASIITVPSEWVAETIRRDMHINPWVIPHGIEWQSWQDSSAENRGFVLWNKNRAGDVCDPTALAKLAPLFQSTEFISTFAPPDFQAPNLTTTGLIPHDQMKKLVQQAGVYLATTKETFGIGILEAMASGVPVLAFDEGGASELVAHGVTGYLAEPGNFDDLATGLDYCQRYGAALGASGREAAQRWTWEDACREVAECYHQALAIKNQPAEVSIIIPVFNKSPEQIGRAINSAVNQELPPAEIIIVDDGSEDSSFLENLTDYPTSFTRFKIIRQHNQGVAHARNAGLAAASSKYVCCLDSDDWLAPEFLRYCVNALEAEPSLAIAYTKITWHDKDGNQGISNWPSDFNFDAMVKGQNQVPTCCVFQRSFWERTGGYRQRYAPTGAGSEDANLWLRIGALGGDGRMVTKKGLFHYSVGQGFVSGNPGYSEVNWRTWHPWTEDSLHPFASQAAPSFISHPVHQYDQPTISVIIPCGPGHAKEIWSALDSLEAQMFRNWEVIVIWDGVDFSSEEIQMIERAFPFANYLSFGGDPMGAGAARNFGAQQARAPFLVFLDADDWLYPETLLEMINAWNETESIIYTDYVGRAIISPEDEEKLAPDLRQRIYHRNPRTNEVVIGYSALDYDCPLAQSMPAAWKDGNPYIWANVTVLIPKIWHEAIGGFDEQMNSWEDIDYHWRLARKGFCYHRIKKELLVYNFHKGHRREGGLQTFRDLVEYIREKYKLEENQIMACSGCGGRKSSTSSATALTGRPMPATQMAAAQPASSDFVLCVYNHPNIGDHMVIGQGLFDYPLDNISMVKTREGYRINYQYHGGGEQFYVHQRDINAQPHIFVPSQAGPVAVPQQPAIQVAARETPPPPSVASQTPRPIPAQMASAEEEPPPPPPAPDISHHLQPSADQQAAIRAAFAQLDELPAEKFPTEAIGNPPLPEFSPPARMTAQPAVGNPQDGGRILVVHDSVTDTEIAIPDQGQKIPATAVDLQLLPGVGAAVGNRMLEMGLDSEESILNTGLDGLTQIPGISEAKATVIINTIKNQQAQREQSPDA